MKCNICHSTRIKKVIKISFRDRFEIACKIFEKNYARNWYQCKKCLVLFNVHKKENEKKIKKISKNYFKIDFPNLKPIERFIKLTNLPKKKSDNFFRVKRIIKNLQKTKNKKKLLDIGAGTGFFLYKLIKSNFKNNNQWSFYSHETDEECVKLLKTIKRNNFLNKNYLKFKKTFDFITLNKVLEHIPKPIHFLKKVKETLKPGGIIYVEVPHISNKLRKYDPSFGSLHWNIYSEQSLNLIASQLDLTVLDIQIIREPSNKKTIFCVLKNK
jgi:2-polyprenyl-3-methyl-5-hydroxy-6-metoxy-1,4-benzoquinol methylase